MIAPGGATWIQENTVPGKLSRRITFGFIKASAINGVYHQNPFNLEHFNFNYVTLVVNDRQQPAKVFTPAFEGNGVDYVHEYLQMYSGVDNLLKMKTLVLAMVIFPEVTLFFF